MTEMHNPAHPGEVLQQWLEGVTVTHAAQALCVTRATLSRILNGHAGISADMALRLSEALDTTPEYWMGMQQAWDLWQARHQDRQPASRLVLPPNP